MGTRLKKLSRNDLDDMKTIRRKNELFGPDLQKWGQDQNHSAVVEIVSDVSFDCSFALRVTPAVTRLTVNRRLQWRLF